MICRNFLCGNHSSELKNGCAYDAYTDVVKSCKKRKQFNRIDAEPYMKQGFKMAKERDTYYGRN